MMGPTPMGSAPPGYTPRPGSGADMLPFHAARTQIACFVLQADREALEAACDRYLTAPTGGTVAYRPLAPYVFIAFEHIPFITPNDRSYWSSEREVAVYFLVGRIDPTTGGGAPAIAQTVDVFMPYMFLDNPKALTLGREIYGFPKDFAWVTTVADAATPGPLSVEVQGVRTFGDAGVDGELARRPLIDVVPAVAPPNPLARTWHSLTHAIEDVHGLLVPGGLGALPGLSLAQEARRLVCTQTIPMLFLKQFYASGDTTRTCYAALVEAGATITQLHRAGLLHGEHDVTIHPLASHPLAEDLGLRAQQRAVLSFYAEFDWDIEPGRDVWSSTEGRTT